MNVNASLDIRVRVLPAVEQAQLRFPPTRKSPCTSDVLLEVFCGGGRELWTGCPRCPWRGDVARHVSALPPPTGRVFRSFAFDLPSERPPPSTRSFEVFSMHHVGRALPTRNRALLGGSTLEHLFTPSENQVVHAVDSLHANPHVLHHSGYSFGE